MKHQIIIILNIIIGILIGLSLFFVFRKPIIKGPNSKDIVGKIYELNGKKYELTPHVCICPLTM
jgi:hypothetical protein